MPAVVAKQVVVVFVVVVVVALAVAVWRSGLASRRERRNVFRLWIEEIHCLTFEYVLNYFYYFTF